jgi:hypothetical protein
VKAKYVYRVVNLEGDTLCVEGSQPRIAQVLGVSESLINSRVKRKVYKNSYFRNEKHKFNVIQMKWDDMLDCSKSLGSSC